MLRILPILEDSLYFRDYGVATPRPCFIELNCKKKILCAKASNVKAEDLRPHVFRWSIPILKKDAAKWLMENILDRATLMLGQYRDEALTTEGCLTEMEIAEFISCVRWGWSDVDPRDCSIRDTDPSSLRPPSDDNVYLEAWLPILMQLKRAVENKDWEPLVKAYRSLPPKAMEIFDATNASHSQA